MALETLLTYVIALALPLWLTIEELVHQSAAARDSAVERPRLRRAEFVSPDMA